MKNGTNGTNGHHHEPILGLPVLPEIAWQEEDYASLLMRLDLYEEYIIGRRYKKGQAGPSFVVDPVDLAGRLGGLNLSTGLLPKDCLFWNRQGGQVKLAVYIEPRVWPVSIQGDPETWHVPLPGFVFVGRGKEYQIWAVKFRPGDPDDAFYVAPVPNMSGAVCQGNAPFPKAGPGTIWQAVAAFFESGFNAHLASGKSKKYQANILDMWRELHAAGAAEYPLDDLVASHGNLKQVMG